MRFTLLVTCGTSLLLNAGRDASNRRPESLTEEAYKMLVSLNERYKLGELARLEPGSIEDNEVKEKHTYKGSELFQTLLHYINKKGGKDASAEVNTIELLMSQNKILVSSIDKIFLYHSDTGTGTLCARVIEEYLRSKGLDIERVEVNGFSSAKTLEQFQEGMVDLMSKIVKVVKGRKRNADSKVYVLATAGFKPESTAAVIAALLAGADGIYYVYERMRELVMIPPIPLAISERSKRYIDSIFKNGYNRDEPIDALLEQGITNDILTTLEERGLIERKGELYSKVSLRGWVRELLEDHR